MSSNQANSHHILQAVSTVQGAKIIAWVGQASCPSMQTQAHQYGRHCCHHVTKVKAGVAGAGGGQARQLRLQHPRVVGDAARVQLRLVLNRGGKGRRRQHTCLAVCSKRIDPVRTWLTRAELH